MLSKKFRCSTQVIDIPDGATAKVRSEEVAGHLAERIGAVAARFGLTATCLQTDGSQPVGRGIGPALEARDVLAVLQNASGAPDDLRRRAATLAGAALEIGGKARRGEGTRLALETLTEGLAWTKFEAICEAQGGMRTPPIASNVHPLVAPHAGLSSPYRQPKACPLAKLRRTPEQGLRPVFTWTCASASRSTKSQPRLHVHAQNARRTRAQCSRISARSRRYRQGSTHEAIDCAGSIASLPSPHAAAAALGHAIAKRCDGSE